MSNKLLKTNTLACVQLGPCGWDARPFTLNPPPQMWELYSGQHAYEGLGRDAIIDRVYKKARLVFPLGVPPTYATLAKACWDHDPSNRPTFVTILAKLTEMLVSFQTANQQPTDVASKTKEAEQ